MTTEWFVLAWVPILPIISKRIAYTTNSDYATYDRSGYYVYTILPLDRKQVLSTYAWFASVVTPLLVWNAYQDELAKRIGDEDMAAGLCLLLTAALIGLPYILRRLAKQKKTRQWKRQSMGLPPTEI